MAFEIDFVPDFTEKIAPKMVEKGLEILKPEIEKSLASAIGSNLKHPENLRYESHRTGQLINSVDASHVFYLDGKKRFKGNVYFKGARTDKNGSSISRKNYRKNDGKAGTTRTLRNGEVAAYKEYGSPDMEGHDQDPSNFIKNANAKTKKRITDAMIKVLEDELKIMEE